MVHKSFFSNRITKLLSLIVIIILLVMTLSPVVLVIINSFKTESEYYNNGPLSLPENFNLDTIKRTWDKMDYLTKLRNSIIISVGVTLIAIIISLFNALALGIGNIKGKMFFIIFFLLGWMLPHEVFVFPLYYIFKTVGLFNNQLSVILTFGVLYTAFGTYYLSTVFSTCEKEIIEAATIDGCNKLQLLFRILVPIFKPALSVLAVLFFMWSWNEFLLPLIFLVSGDKQNIIIAMALVKGKAGSSVTSQSAAALLGILPTIILFFIFQRNLTRGITVGTIK